MNTTINLLPWRDERRKQRQQEFIALLVIAALVGGLVFWGWKGLVESQVSDQQSRNRHIESRIAVLDDRIKEINELRARREALVTRMEVIQSLQGHRPTIVYLFDELVRTLPEGVFYTRVQRQNDTFTIEGLAESNNRISRLMRNLDQSDWFMAPNLQRVTTSESAALPNQFIMVVKEAAPLAEGEEADNESR